MRLIHGGSFNFSKTLKSHAHLHIMGNVIVIFFNLFLASNFWVHKKFKVDCGSYFEFQLNFEKITCTFPYRGACDGKI